MTPYLDTDFDFRSDTPKEKDPDRYSARLREYHQILWSKPLPCGTKFQLTRSTGHTYLEHRSELGNFSVSSDSVIPAYRKYREVAGFIGAIPEDQKCEFQRLGYTIGGMMIFPSNRIGGKKTINAERGLNRYIRDRFDLTVECIKRHYEGVSSPLSDTLSRYASFFALFESFRGYIDFFLLQDIVSQIGRAHV